MSGASFQALMASTASVGTIVTFDGVSSGVTLSNGNLTVTNAGGTGATNGARSTANKSTGKFYFEITVTASNGNDDTLGIITSGGTFANMSSGGTNCAEIIRVNGVVFSNNGFQGNLSTVSAGTVVCFAFDLGAHLCWIRKGAGNWNGSPTADPATGAGGFALATSVSYAPAITFGGAGGTNGDHMTANFGATAYAQTPPSGFGNWTP